ncbi:MAG: radical SAM protein [Candidatus Margulisbacteria bacterium]|jgi:organic radical activating enzyme|nr:radical SAM protein [Candidatus Margulisiibacteriota bacterium]
MYLYETIGKELENYPPAYFLDRFKLDSLTVELTKHCTNSCAHCSNYGSPRSGEFLSLELLKNIVDQAAELKQTRLAFWGGEPFLHQDFTALLEYVLRKGFNVGIITNGFWAKSEQAVRDFVCRFQKLLRGGQFIKLVVSCDRFHQTQPATPRQNIINVVSVLETDRPRGFDYDLQSVEYSKDNTFAEVLRCLEKQGIETGRVKLKQRTVPLEYSVGRAKKLSVVENNPYAKRGSALSDNEPKVKLFITVSGDAVLYENFVGEKILPVGNIKNLTLADLEDKLNSNRLLKLLHFQPLKFFFYPFRKYLDIQNFCVELSNGKIQNMFYARDKVAEVLQVKEKRFDKSPELKKARKIYTQKMNAAQTLACLRVIEDYGDLADSFFLRELVQKSEDKLLKQKISSLLQTAYSLAY